MVKLKRKLNSNLYTQAYLQSGGGGHNFPVYRGQRGGGFGRILGKFIKPIFKLIVPQIKKQAVKHALPLTKKIAKRAMEHGLDQAKEVFSGRKKFKQGMKDLAKATAKSAKNETIKKMKGGRRKNNKIRAIGKGKRKDIFSNLPTV